MMSTTSDEDKKSLINDLTHEEFFKIYGQTTLSEITEEQRYQFYKKRMLAEVIITLDLTERELELSRAAKSMAEYLSRGKHEK